MQGQNFQPRKKNLRFRDHHFKKKRKNSNSEFKREFHSYDKRALDIFRRRHLIWEIALWSGLQPWASKGPRNLPAPKWRRPPPDFRWPSPALRWLLVFSDGTGPATMGSTGNTGKRAIWRKQKVKWWRRRRRPAQTAPTTKSAADGRNGNCKSPPILQSFRNRFANTKCHVTAFRNCSGKFFVPNNNYLRICIGTVEISR